MTDWRALCLAAAVALVACAASPLPGPTGEQPGADAPALPEKSPPPTSAPEVASGAPFEEAEAFFHDAAAAVLAAASGRGHDVRWDGPDPLMDLRAPVERRSIPPGDLEPLMVVAELNLVSGAEPTLRELHTLLIVLPELGLRFLEVTPRDGGGLNAYGEALREEAPELQSLAEDMSAALGEEPCALPTVTAGDAPRLPEPLRSQIAAVGELDFSAACREARAAVGPWRLDVVEDFVVIARAGDAEVHLVSSMRVTPRGNLYLGRVRVEPAR